MAWRGVEGEACMVSSSLMKASIALIHEIGVDLGPTSQRDLGNELGKQGSPIHTLLSHGHTTHTLPICYGQQNPCPYCLSYTQIMGKARVWVMDTGTQWQP